MLNIRLECAKKDITQQMAQVNVADRPLVSRWILDWENSSKARWPMAKVALTSVVTSVVLSHLQLDR